MKKYLPLVFILVLAVIARLVVAFLPPEQILYTVDERIVRDSTLMLFMNAMPVSLEWPATTLMIPLYIFGFLEMLFTTPLLTSLIHFDLVQIADVFTEYIYTQFNGFHFIKTGRIFVALTCLGSYFFIFGFLENEKRSFAYCLVLLFTLSPALIKQSWVLHPDSLSIVFWLMFLLYYILRFNFFSNRSIAVCAGLFALVIASKFVYIIFLPILLLSMVVLNYRKAGFKVTAKQTTKFVAAALILFVALCPFAWTNVLSFTKGFVGNVVTKSEGQGNSWMALLTAYLPALVTYPGLVLAVIGVPASFKKFGTVTAIFLVVTFLLFAYPIANATQTFERYSLPMLPILLIWASCGFAGLYERYKLKNYMQYALAGILVLALTHSFFDVRSNYLYYHQPTNFQACKNWLNTNLKNNEKIFLPVSFEGFMPENRNCVERILARNNDSVLLRNRLMLQFKPEYQNRQVNIKGAIMEDLFLDEKKYFDQKTRVKIDYLATHADTVKRYGLYYYTENVFSSHTCFKYEEALKDTTVKYFLTEYKPAPGLQLIEKFDQYDNKAFYLYAKASEL